MSDTTSEGGRATGADPAVQRLEKVLSKHHRETQRTESASVQRRSDVDASGAAQPSTAETAADSAVATTRRDRTVCQLRWHVVAIRLLL